MAAPPQPIQHTGINDRNSFRSGVSASGLRLFIAVVAVLAACHGVVPGLVLIREFILHREAAPGSY